MRAPLRTTTSTFAITIAVCTVLALFETVSSKSTSLTKSNYADQTAGKVVFIKFFAPWCGHCKAMADDWERLASDYADNPNIMIAEVDCTDEDNDNDELCEQSEVNGFPTLKYGDPMALEEYDDGRDYESLSSFAKEHLKPSCSPQNLDLCDDDKKQLIQTLSETSVTELEAKVKEVDDALEEIEQWFITEEDKLQDLYEQLHMDYADKKKQTRETKQLSLLKSILSMKKQQSKSTTTSEL